MDAYSQIMFAARDRLRDDEYLADIPVLIENYGIPLHVSRVARSANLATVQTSLPHGLRDGQQILVRKFDDALADFATDFAVITVTDATHVRYENPGADLAESECDAELLPLFVPTATSIERSLAHAGFKPGSTGKSGVAVIVYAKQGAPADRLQTEAQRTTLQVTLLFNPLINAAGLRKHPLRVLQSIQARLATWQPAPGQRVTLVRWDSLENAHSETGYFLDFDVPHLLTFES